MTQHFLFDRLGARDTYLGIADRQQRSLGTLHDGGRTKVFRHPAMVIPVTQRCDGGISQHTGSGGILYN